MAPVWNQVPVHSHIILSKCYMQSCILLINLAAREMDESHCLVLLEILAIRAWQIMLA